MMMRMRMLRCAQGWVGTGAPTPNPLLGHPWAVRLPGPGLRWIDWWEAFGVTGIESAVASC